MQNTPAPFHASAPIHAVAFPISITGPFLCFPVSIDLIADVFVGVCPE